MNGRNTFMVLRSQPSDDDIPIDRRGTLAAIAVFPYCEGMEVHFKPETEKRLKDLAAQTGSGNADLLVQDVVDEYFGDLAHARETLDRRYDDLESGKVKPVPGDEVIARLRAKSAAYRASRNESL